MLLSGAVPAHAESGPPTAHSPAFCRRAAPRVLAASDLPVPGRPVVRGEAEHHLERDVAMEAPVEVEDELVEVDVDVLGRQPVVGAEASELHQRENPVDPRQGDVSGHLPDDTRVVAVFLEAEVRSVAIADQRRPGCHVGAGEGLDRPGRVVGDGGEPDAPGAGVQVLRALRPRPTTAAARADLDGADDEDFPRLGLVDRRSFWARSQAVR